MASLGACRSDTGNASPPEASAPTADASAPPSTNPSGLWLPTADRPLTLHWVLGGAVDLSDPVQAGLRDLSGNTLPEPDVYDIDGEYNSAATVAELHRRGKKVICYFDAGVYETYRPDAAQFPAGSPKIYGNPDQGWNGSFWLDIRRISDLAPIMKHRIDVCKQKGFDAVEPDEVTGWSNNSGFPLTYQDQIAYNRAVAGWAHNAGLSVLLKGDLEQAHDLVGNFDFTLNEECFQYDECTTVSNQGPGADGKDYPGLQLFVQANKAVFIAEYRSRSASTWSIICSTSQAQHFNTSLYTLGLPTNGARTPCRTSAPDRW
jgi:endo-alpha-1,4-polygalactosaminidase (GH114 family)